MRELESMLTNNYVIYLIFEYFIIVTYEDDNRPNGFGELEHLPSGVIRF